MSIIDIHEAQAQLPSVLDRVEAGEEVVISRHGRPVAKFVRCGHVGKRRSGALRGRISIDNRFFDPLPEAELTAWDR